MEGDAVDAAERVLVRGPVEKDEVADCGGLGCAIKDELGAIQQDAVEKRDGGADEEVAN